VISGICGHTAARRICGRCGPSCSRSPSSGDRSVWLERASILFLVASMFFSAHDGTCESSRCRYVSSSSSRTRPLCDVPSVGRPCVAGAHRASSWPVIRRALGEPLDGRRDGRHVNDRWSALPDETNGAVGRLGRRGRGDVGHAQGAEDPVGCAGFQCLHTALRARAPRIFR